MCVCVCFFLSCCLPLSPSILCSQSSISNIYTASTLRKSLETWCLFNETISGYLKKNPSLSASWAVCHSPQCSQILQGSEKPRTYFFRLLCVTISNFDLMFYVLMFKILYIIIGNVNQCILLEGLSKALKSFAPIRLLLKSYLMEIYKKWNPSPFLLPRGQLSYLCFHAGGMTNIYHHA
jgi:hypothetical protein